jgi:putative endonuclease
VGLAGILSLVFTFSGPVNDWSVYIIRCDDSSLYTGISTDVPRRLQEHRSGDGKAAKYTKPFSSIRLVYEILIGDRSQAAKIEYQIKKLPKQKKEFIVSNCLSRDELVTFIKLNR